MAVAHIGSSPLTSEPRQEVGSHGAQDKEALQERRGQAICLYAAVKERVLRHSCVTTRPVGNSPWEHQDVRRTPRDLMIEKLTRFAREVIPAFRRNSRR